MGVTQAALVEWLKLSLGDSASRFSEPDDAAFKRHVKAAALDFGRVRSVTGAGTLELVADQSDYAAPADFVRFKTALWGMDQRKSPKPWEKSWAGPFPDVHVMPGLLILSPAPSAKQIAILGGTYRFLYFAGLVAGATPETSTVSEADSGLLILRAQAEAMRELAMRDALRPVRVTDGYTGQSKTSSPAGLATAFLAEFERLAAQR